MPPQMVAPFLCVSAFLLGAIVGSFLNVCIYRLPLEKSLIWPGSHCPKCLRPVRAYDNIPILSWLLLRGRCRHCGEHFSARYMFIELLTAAIFAAVTWMMAPHGIALFARTGCYLALLSLLIVATFIDFDLQIIPDSVTVPGIVLGLIGCTIVPDVPLVSLNDLAPEMPMNAAARGIYTTVVVAGVGLWLLGVAWYVRHWGDQPGVAEVLLLGASAALLAVQVWSSLVAWGLIGQNGIGWPAWLVAHPHWAGFWTSVYGIVVGAALIWIVRVVGSAAMRREAMGFGDVTLMAMIGAMLGWPAAVCVFFLAPFMGLAVGVVQWLAKGENLLPYGPYLSMAAAVALVAWPSIWPILGVRLGLLAQLGIAGGGIALLILLPILLLSLRINSRLDAEEMMELAKDATQ